jgi:hypothetical protein
MVAHFSLMCGRVMTAANLANILADIVSLTWYLGAAGCSYFEGCGIYFCEYVYGNLRDPKIHTPTLGQTARGTKTTSREHVVLFYLHPEILMCSQQTSTKSHQEMRAVQSVGQTALSNVTCAGISFTWLCLCVIL